MIFDPHEIMDDAYLFANVISEVLKESNKIESEPLSKTYTENVILGAIQSYHKRLQMALSEKGIDIESMEYDNHS